ncbi:molybdate ABC transporter permease subunit [Zhaonella formicivorans]|uniref:molybdate ABC transporter permease subunit n=1 Tax=Zhaonella formicivorans TaxID=2528593 RepID=UPI0010D09FCA|nr:molybdate ABC transporter permease subunit [Zhaonella formicivorans]
MSSSELQPLLLSLQVAGLATLLVIMVGLPVSLILAKANFIGKNLLDAFFTLPMVLPPTVLGYYLLVAIGRQSPLGAFLETRFGVNLVFTWQAAVLAAFISSLPLMVKSAKAAFGAIDVNIENAARTLGRPEWEIFFTVTLPLAWKGIAAGVTLAFARALGDFGTTIMVAGNIPGKTQTMPIAIYDAVLAGDTARANYLVLIITVTAFTILFILNRLENKY